MKYLSKLYLRIAPERFHYLKFILEGYDNIGILSSFSSAEGIVFIRYPESMERDLFALLQSIAGKLHNVTRSPARI